jgi:hypothetical protein
MGTQQAPDLFLSQHLNGNPTSTRCWWDSWRGRRRGLWALLGALLAGDTSWRATASSRRSQWQGQRNSSSKGGGLGGLKPLWSKWGARVSSSAVVGTTVRSCRHPLMSTTGVPTRSSPRAGEAWPDARPFNSAVWLHRTAGGAEGGRRTAGRLVAAAGVSAATRRVADAQPCTPQPLPPRQAPRHSARTCLLCYKQCIDPTKDVPYARPHDHYHMHDKPPVPSLLCCTPALSPALPARQTQRGAGAAAAAHVTLHRLHACAVQRRSAGCSWVLLGAPVLGCLGGCTPFH